jgi:hypothetical protein
MDISRVQVDLDKKKKKILLFLKGDYRPPMKSIPCISVLDSKSMEGGYSDLLRLDSIVVLFKTLNYESPSIFGSENFG